MLLSASRDSTTDWINDSMTASTRAVINTTGMVVVVVVVTKGSDMDDDEDWSYVVGSLPLFSPLVIYYIYIYTQL